MDDRAAPFERDRMRADDGAGLSGRGDGGLAVVSQFASVVVSLLAERSAQQKSVTPLSPPCDEIVKSFIQASLSGSERAFDDLLGHFRRTRISISMLADVYIPEAARRMGVAWEEDELSWLDVSIGAARLQSLLREISVAWSADQSDSLSNGAVLLLVPEGEQHTLGPMVAMGQLRRMGISVCLRMGPGHRELSNLLDNREFDGILISTATQQRLQAATSLIRAMRTLRKKLPPVVLGGPIVMENPQLAACAGADYSCIDIGTAMEAIGLTLSEHGSRKRA